MPRSDSSNPPPALPIEVKKRGAWTVVRFTEASLMDVKLIEALHARVLEVVAGGSTQLVLDFSQVEYISSSMFGVLVATREAVAKAGGTLVLCALNERLNRLLKLARLDSIFTVAPDVAAATKAPKRSG